MWCNKCRRARGGRGAGGIPTSGETDIPAAGAGGARRAAARGRTTSPMAIPMTPNSKGEISLFDYLFQEVPFPRTLSTIIDTAMGALRVALLLGGAAASVFQNQQQQVPPPRRPGGGKSRKNTNAKCARVAGCRSSGPAARPPARPTIIAREEEKTCVEPRSAGPRSSLHYFI